MPRRRDTKASGFAGPEVGVPVSRAISLGLTWKPARSPSKTLRLKKRGSKVAPRHASAERSPSPKKTAQDNSGSATKKKKKKRPAWDSTIQDLDKHKLSPEKMEARKQMFVSKHTPHAKQLLEEQRGRRALSEASPASDLETTTPGSVSVEVTRPSSASVLRSTPSSSIAHRRVGRYSPSKVKGALFFTPPPVSSMDDGQNTEKWMEDPEEEAEEEETIQGYTHMSQRRTPTIVTHRDEPVTTPLQESLAGMRQRMKQMEEELTLSSSEAGSPRDGDGYAAADDRSDERKTPQQSNATAKDTANLSPAVLLSSAADAEAEIEATEEALNASFQAMEQQLKAAPAAPTPKRQPEQQPQAQADKLVLDSVNTVSHHLSKLLASEQQNEQFRQTVMDSLQASTRQLQLMSAQMEQMKQENALLRRKLALSQPSLFSTPSRPLEPRNEIPQAAPPNVPDMNDSLASSYPEREEDGFAVLERVFVSPKRVHAAVHSTVPSAVEKRQESENVPPTQRAVQHRTPLTAQPSRTIRGRSFIPSSASRLRPEWTTSHSQDSVALRTPSMPRPHGLQFMSPAEVHASQQNTPVVQPLSPQLSRSSSSTSSAPTPREVPVRHQYPSREVFLQHDHAPIRNPDRTAVPHGSMHLAVRR